MDLDEWMYIRTSQLPDWKCFMYDLSNRNGLPRDAHCFSGSLLGRVISTLPDSVCAFTRKPILASSVASTVSFNNRTPKLHDFTELTYGEVQRLPPSLSL